MDSKSGNWIKNPVTWFAFTSLWGGTKLLQHVLDQSSFFPTIRTIGKILWSPQHSKADGQAQTTCHQISLLQLFKRAPWTCLNPYWCKLVRTWLVLMSHQDQRLFWYLLHWPKSTLNMAPCLSAVTWRVNGSQILITYHTVKHHGTSSCVYSGNAMQ